MENDNGKSNYLHFFPHYVSWGIHLKPLCVTEQSTIHAYSCFMLSSDISKAEWFV